MPRRKALPVSASATGIPLMAVSEDGGSPYDQMLFSRKMVGTPRATHSEGGVRLKKDLAPTPTSFVASGLFSLSRLSFGAFASFPLERPDCRFFGRRCLRISPIHHSEPWFHL